MQCSYTAFVIFKNNGIHIIAVYVMLIFYVKLVFCYLVHNLFCVRVMKMASNSPVPVASNKSKAHIATIAVIDLETTNLPEFNNNRTSITELCIYAFDSVILKDNEEPMANVANYSSPLFPETNILPRLPRVLHKLNLLFQPSMLVHPGAEQVTGLNNYILERESKLNENAAEIILKFVEHLRPPVCLVAHNGWAFDFPIVKQALEKLNTSLPISVRCVDSLRAFMEIDERRNEEILVEDVSQPERKAEQEIATSSSPSDKSFDWQAVNESTPKRAIQFRGSKATRKRKLLRYSDDDEETSATKYTQQDLHARRQLFTGLNCSQKKRIPPRGRYGLGHLFERTFEQPATNAHQAEADVNMLTKLIQRYGVDFLAFAEEQAIPFADVVPLGRKIAK